MEKESIMTIKGIGVKTAALFSKLGIETTEDLLKYFPRAYDIYNEPVTIAQMRRGGKCAVNAYFARPIDMFVRRGKNIISTTIEDATGVLTVKWYNMPYLSKTLRPGRRFVLRGEVTQRRGGVSLEQPRIFTIQEYEKLINSFMPVYGLTKGLSNNMLTKAVRAVIEKESYKHDEFIPNDILEEYSLMSYADAIRAIHFPKNKDRLTEARRRFIFDEFFLFALVMRLLKNEKTSVNSSYVPLECVKTDKVISLLPFKLTSAQNRAFNEIRGDLTGGSVMSRLIQGDVGSGKTIIAFLAMFQMAENGYQSAIMAPTEVLAVQHYESLMTLIKSQGIDWIRPVLLTGSTSSKKKKYESISSGEVNIIVGTHAIIVEKIKYASLGLVITDEQHRFGVRQRESLAAKGKQPHILVMSATPIPRTLAIILYGDLSISVLDELPACRLPIKNCTVDITYRKTAYNFITKQVLQGRQAYIICPMVEENEATDLISVNGYYKLLRDIFPKEINIGILHGQMRPDEKNAAFEAFHKNEINILIATTVVEVGIDVPNATVIMVENAERFGLAQLHQLRGRVGRGAYQSYAIFVQGQADETASKRLGVVTSSNDGFYIASEDLKLRGPGDFLGVRQSGDQRFKIADVTRDGAILKEASDLVGKLFLGKRYFTDPACADLRGKTEAHKNTVIYGGSL